LGFGEKIAIREVNFSVGGPFFSSIIVAEIIDVGAREIPSRAIEPTHDSGVQSSCCMFCIIGFYYSQ
jgi:hypothetical protein